MKPLLFVADLQTVNAKLEEKIRLRDKSVLEKDVAIENKTKQINLLEQVCKISIN